VPLLARGGPVTRKIGAPEYSFQELPTAVVA
jgi:hypothetical protein